MQTQLLYYTFCSIIKGDVLFTFLEKKYCCLCSLLFIDEVTTGTRSRINSEQCGTSLSAPTQLNATEMIGSHFTMTEVKERKTEDEREKGRKGWGRKWRYVWWNPSVLKFLDFPFNILIWCGIVLSPFLSLIFDFTRKYVQENTWQ